MRAYQLTAWQHPAELREVPKPSPGPGEVLVKVGGAGACHSDLHLMEWPEGALPFELPFTLGHENAGWVDTLGEGVVGVEVGEPVAVYGPWGCGRCAACRQSKENLCERQDQIGAFGGGLGLDGGMAEFLLVPSPRLLLPLGDLDPRDAAPLTDAALTPYHAIKRALPRLGAGSTAVVIGVGGLGQMAVQILRALTPARVIALDTNERHLAAALDAGAARAIVPEAGTTADVRALTRGGLGADLVLDVVGSDDTIALAATLARAEGQLTVIGLGGGALPWTAMGILPWECEVTSTYWGSAVELDEVLQLARDGAISTRVARFPLDQVADAYAAMRAGDLDGRAVICPSG